MDYLMAHLVGDYLVQDDYMAMNKKKSTFACLLHVFSYTLIVWAFTQWPLWALVITAVCHFIQDRTSIVRQFMTLNRQEAFATGPCSPWSIIVVDNVLHLLQLYLTNEAVLILQGAP